MMDEKTIQGTTHDLDQDPSELRDSAKQESELRLVLLGWAGTGKSSLANAILGSPVFKTRRGSASQKSVTMNCEKGCANVAGRQVVLVDTPDWFYSESPPEEVQHQLVLCESLASPGPHAFLLCISIRRPHDNLQTLDALEKVFGVKAITKHTVVLFTDMDQLSEGQTLQEVLHTKQQDVLELVERCGNRYHIMRVEGEKEVEKGRKSVEELLKKVEEMVKESEEEFCTCPPILLYTQQEDRKVKTSTQRNVSSEIGSRWKDEFGEDLELEMNAEKIEEVGDLGAAQVGSHEAPESGLEPEDDIALSPPAHPPSFLRWVWDTVVEWLLWLPNMVRGSTLLGSIVGLFFGGAMGATVGSVATEVGRRKNKAKVKSN